MSVGSFTNSLIVALTVVTWIGNLQFVTEDYLTAMGNHLPSGIIQCYLRPSSGDFPAFTAAEAGT